MSSEEEGFYLDPPEQTGRTFWDLFAGKKMLMLAIFGIIAAIALLYIYRDRVSMEEVVSLAREYWFILLAPVFGWVLGILVAKRLHVPLRRGVLCVNPEDHSVRVVSIPETLFRFFNQAGNPVVYHTPNGTPVYLACEIDLQNMHIDYGMVNDHDAALVMTWENSYVSWRKTLDKVMRDNLRLMDTPHVLGIQYAGKSLKKHLERLSRTVGVEDDTSGPDDYGPEWPNDEKVSLEDEQSD